MTARVAMGFHPELDGRSQRDESTLYVHVRNGRIDSAEVSGAVFTVPQLRALAELSGWNWVDFVQEVKWRADDQRVSVRPEALHV